MQLPGSKLSVAAASEDSCVRRLPDCNACVVFDGADSNYLTSAEQTVFLGCTAVSFPVAHEDELPWGSMEGCSNTPNF